MRRRDFLNRTVLTGTLMSTMSRAVAADVSAAYAESVAVFGVTRDGAKEFSFRLSRRPQRESGSLWASVSMPGVRLGAAINELSLGETTQATSVEDDHVAFVVEGDASARFERSGLRSTLSGKASTSVSAFDSAEPPLGLGKHQLNIEAEFRSWHESFYPRTGRLELMGDVSATVTTPSGTQQIEGIGAWHEQVGNRPRFAPGFTYFKVMGDRIGVLASVRHDTTTAWGYAYLNNKIARVNKFQIDEQQEVRQFEIHLDDGKVVSGKAQRIRKHSVPIEGRRRPGTTVRASSTIGSLIGMLNDWDPE